MKIPERYQIFDASVPITYADQDRLAPHLSNWNRLNEVMLLGIGETDLRKMVVLEVMGKRRKPILTRLITAVLRAERKRIEFNIEDCA